MSDKRTIDQDRLDMFEALLAAIERRNEVSSVIAASEDEDAAVQAVKDLLGIAEAHAVEVLNMPWRRLAGDSRRRLQNERDAVRRRLDERR